MEAKKMERMGLPHGTASSMVRTHVDGRNGGIVYTGEPTRNMVHTRMEQRQANIG